MRQTVRVAERLFVMSNALRGRGRGAIVARVSTVVVLVAAIGVTPGAAQKDTPVAMHAKGSFEVKLTPQNADPQLGRMTIAKQLHGDLDGTSAGEMLTAMTGVKDSAGYVAIERVAGTLHGKRGTFVLQHHATMNRGEQQLTIEVVPDSGTDQLTGIAGTMTIMIDTAGRHFYDFEYTVKE